MTLTGDPGGEEGNARGCGGLQGRAGHPARRAHRRAASSSNAMAAALPVRDRPAGGRLHAACGRDPGTPGKDRTMMMSHVVDGVLLAGAAADQPAGRRDVSRAEAAARLPESDVEVFDETSRAAARIADAVRHLGNEGRRHARAPGGAGRRGARTQRPTGSRGAAVERSGTGGGGRRRLSEDDERAPSVRRPRRFASSMKS